jgi:hypothetical protein
MKRNYRLSIFGQKKGRFVMKKWFVCLLLGLLPCGCADIQHTGHEQEKPLYEIQGGHLYGLVEKRHIRLTKEQLEEIAHYGIKIREDEKVIVYYSMARKRGRGEIGKAFLVNGEGEYGTFELVVHIVSNMIYDIHIIKNPKGYTENPVINKEFLEQFIGKDLTFSFKFAKEKEDVLTTPTKIKPIRNASVTSVKIAKEFRKWLVITKVANL